MYLLLRAPVAILEEEMSVLNLLDTNSHNTKGYANQDHVYVYTS